MLALSENFLNETISESMVDNLAEITKELSGCKQWFRYRIGRIIDLGASPDSLGEYECCGKGVVEVKCPLCAEETSLQQAVNSNVFCLDRRGDSSEYSLKKDHSHY